jgi:HK97 family phage major capsid protein
MGDFPEVLDAVKDMSAAIDHFRTGYDQRLRDVQRDRDEDRQRLELLEAGRSSPGQTGAGSAAPLRYKSYHVGDATLYELPSDVKLSDVLRPATPPPVSFSRWLGAQMAGEHCKDREALEYARSVEKKQLLTSTTGVLVPVEFQSEWIDLIRSNLVLNAAGMTTVVMDNKTYNASRLATDPTSAWHSEAAAITVANPTFTSASMTAQTLTTRCSGSVELSQDSPDFGEQLARAMARSMAVALDEAGLVGSGTPPTPRGITNTTGRGSVTGVGAVTDYSKVLQGVRILLDANLSLEVATRVAVMSPRVWEKFEGLATGISGDKTQLARPRALEATRFLVTSGQGLDTGSPGTGIMILGDFSDLVLGVRRAAAVEVVKTSEYVDKLVVEFIGYGRFDYLVRRPASFVTLEGITT